MKMRQAGGGGGGEREWHSRTALPSTPLVFLAFFTYHYLPLPERLEQGGIGFHGTRKNQNPQRLFQVGETCRIKQPFFST